MGLKFSLVLLRSFGLLLPLGAYAGGLGTNAPYPVDQLPNSFCKILIAKITKVGKGKVKVLHGFECSASYVGKEELKTAAHCLDGFNKQLKKPEWAGASPFYKCGRDLTRFDGGFRAFDMKKFTKNSNYDSSNNNNAFDFGKIELSAPPPNASELNVLPVVKDTNEWKKLTSGKQVYCLLVGSGDDPIHPEKSGQLQAGQIPGFVSISDTRKYIEDTRKSGKKANFPVLLNNVPILIDPSNPTISWEGDSGGSVICSLDGRTGWKQVGVISGGGVLLNDKNQPIQGAFGDSAPTINESLPSK